MWIYAFCCGCVCSGWVGDVYVAMVLLVYMHGWCCGCVFSGGVVVVYVVVVFSVCM